MKSVLVNWKTTICGILVIATGITLIVIGHPEVGIPCIPIGIGLLVAKDGNVTGGTTRQPSK